MIRVRFIAQVRYGHFAEYLKAGERLNEIARERGWAEATFWVSVAGTANELFVEREGEAQNADAEWMKVIRSTVDMVVQGSARSELFRTAPQLA